MYWSAVVRFINKPVATVEDTKLTHFLVKRMNTEVMLANMPPAVMAPPKHIAQIMSQMVSIMPDMPRLEINSFISAFPASKEVLPNNVFMPPLTSDITPSPVPEISNNNSGWNIKANTMASMADKNKVMMEGTLLAIITPVKIGTIINQMEICNL